MTTEHPEHPEHGSRATDTTSEPAVICRDVHKSYGSFHALRGISTTIGEGETVVVFGPSGSAKSTFLRCLNRLEVHDSGDIIVNGVTLDHHVSNLPKVRRDVGMVFQHFHLFPHLTVRRNITLAPQVVAHVPAAEANERAEHLLERVGIPQLIDMYPSDLSGGQMQRVAIARALAMKPPPYARSRSRWNPACCCWTSRHPPWTRRASVASSACSATWPRRA